MLHAMEGSWLVCVSFNKLLVGKSQVGGWPPFALEETFGRWKLFCFCQIAVSIGNFYCITVVNLLVNGSGTWLLNITEVTVMV